MTAQIRFRGPTIHSDHNAMFCQAGNFSHQGIIRRYFSVGHSSPNTSQCSVPCDANDKGNRSRQKKSRLVKFCHNSQTLRAIVKIDITKSLSSCKHFSIPWKGRCPSIEMPTSKLINMSIKTDSIRSAYKFVFSDTIAMAEMLLPII